MFAQRGLVTFMCGMFVVVSGCTHSTRYNPSYLAAANPSAVEPTSGKGLLYTRAEDDHALFTGSPTSFTGGATTLEIPLGNMTKEIAMLVFKDMFPQGYQSANGLENVRDYDVGIHPQVVQFVYGYNQLKNLGFAITPQVRIVLRVKLYDQEGRVFFEKNYDSGMRDGDTYLVTFSPGEAISKTAHVVLYTLMREAALEIAQELRKKQQKEARSDRMQLHVLGEARLEGFLNNDKTRTVYSRFAQMRNRF